MSVFASVGSMACVSRRAFIARSSLALGGGALFAAGCLSSSPERDASGVVRFGVISDTHVTGPESAPELERALRFLASRKVDAVIHCGDITDFGYVRQLEAFADAWRRMMPPDMPFIPVMGNRDFSDTRRMSDEKRAADHDKLLRAAPEERVRRILGVDLGSGNRVTTVKGVPVVASDWKHEAGLEKFMLAHPELRDPSKPFVHVQHPHPGGTIHGNAVGDDPVTCWLNMFPKAVSVSGHSHKPFTAPNMFCCREFTAAGAGSHYLGGGEQQKGIREVSVLSIWNAGMSLERFGLHNGFHDVQSRNFTPPPEPDRATPGSFVFAQWNVGGFCLGQDGAAGAERVAAFRRQIAEIGADFIGLCEYAPLFQMQGRPAHDAVFGEYRESAIGPRLGANGNAVLSRNAPLSGVRFLHFGHRTQQRYCTVCEAQVAGVKTVFVQTHLDLDAGNRKSQLDELVGMFGDLPSVILSADFNEASADEFAPFLNAGFKMANCSGLGTFFTHRRRNTAFTPAIDNVLVKGFDVLSARTADDAMILSDHRVLVCRLAPRSSRR